MRILAAAADTGATIADIRLAQPLQALCAADGWPLQLRSFHACARADLGGADVLRAVDDAPACQAMADAAGAQVAAHHTSAHTVDAWRRLLSSLGPRPRPPVRGGAVARVLGGAAERVVIALRAANRKRLARRTG